MSSQVIDTAIFAVVVWAPIAGLRPALALGASKYIFKLVIAIIDTSCIYWARYAFVQRHPAESRAA